MKVISSLLPPTHLPSPALSLFSHSSLPGVSKLVPPWCSASQQHRSNRANWLWTETSESMAQLKDGKSCLVNCLVRALLSAKSRLATPLLYNNAAMQWCSDAAMQWCSDDTVGTGSVTQPQSQLWLLDLLSPASVSPLKHISQKTSFLINHMDKQCLTWKSMGPRVEYASPTLEGPNGPHTVEVSSTVWFHLYLWPDGQLGPRTSKRKA